MNVPEMHNKITDQLRAAQRTLGLMVQLCPMPADAQEEKAIREQAKVVSDLQRRLRRYGFPPRSLVWNGRGATKGWKR